MLDIKILLYPIVFNKQFMHYQILSDHPEKYEECYATIKDTISFIDQVSNLFNEYFDIDNNYIKFITLEPEIKDSTLYIPVYCLVPYLVKLKKGYLLPVYQYALHIQNIRKILNVV